ncbi:hypothetical protein KBC75_04800 [Candidatus Shapirobacteria bacterium]|nr:hypothetical protein [Candidatus Shapirobacteria bacterium]
MTQPQQKNTMVKSTSKPIVPQAPRPFQQQQISKSFMNNRPKSFATAFRTQSKGVGGK